MELSEKLLLARREAGLSQRQLSGEKITRNMLSQIEHGTARPSMETLRYLAGRLGKPVSYFLDEEAEPVPANQMLETLTALEKARRVMEEGRFPYARELLEGADSPWEPLQREKLLLLAKLPGMDLQELCRRLPSLDEELFLRARAALDGEDADRGAHLLRAMENRESPGWHLLMGRVLLKQGLFREAAGEFHQAEGEYPVETSPCLEACYRELEDFKRAYEYACKQKR